MNKQINRINDHHQWPTWPTYAEDEINAVVQVLQSGKVNYWTGEQCHLFEQEYAKSVGTPYAVALMNGTIALEAALYALDIGPGDEVITACRTFIASASAVVMRQATPILADVDADSQNLTAKTIAAVISPRTKAIIVVHLAGWPADMEAIGALAKQYGLYVIEDCAQAHGAAYQGRQVGSWGDIAAFSFCQDKIITTGGEGGMITTPHRDLWEKIWSFKDHGKSYAAVYKREHPPGFRFLHESFGTNWRMTEMQAAIGRLQLQKLPEWVRIRQQHAAILNQTLSTLPALRLTIPPHTVKHAYYKHYVFIRPEQLKPDWNRNRLLETLIMMGVPCFAGSCSEIYQEQAFLRSNLQPLQRRSVAKMLGETSLMFLVHPSLTEEDMYRMANIIAEVMVQASLSVEKELV